MSDGASVKEGDVLAGKYRVERVLGVGGMGIVVAAQHLQLGQRVALKFLLREACAQPGAVERFLREARAAVQIRSEHVARVIDVGTMDSGPPYMVMEYLQGNDLAGALSDHGPLRVPDAVGYLLQACEAVAEAHSLGIVHRDLKPANLFLTTHPDGSALIKVLDFGISKAVSRDGNSISATATTAVMGSPKYMSPEQVRSSKNVDARTDVWALGVTLHELLTGRAVFEGDTVTGILAAVIADPPAPLRAHWPEAPAELERIILRCLEKDCARRYQNVAQLAQSLLLFAPPAARASVERIKRLLPQAQALEADTSNEGAGQTTELPAAFGAGQTAQLPSALSDPPGHASRPNIDSRRSSSSRSSSSSSSSKSSSSSRRTGGSGGSSATVKRRRPGPALWVAVGGALAVATGLAAWFLPGQPKTQTPAAAAEPGPAQTALTAQAASPLPAPTVVAPVELPRAEPSAATSRDAGPSAPPEATRPQATVAPSPPKTTAIANPRPRPSPPRTTKPPPATTPPPPPPAGTTGYDHF